MPAPAAAAPPPAPTNSTKEAAEALELALNQVESMLGEVEQRAQAVKTIEGVRVQPSENDQLGRSLHEALRRLEEALEQLRDAGRQLVGEVGRLSQLADRLEAIADRAGEPSEPSLGPELVANEPVPLPVPEPAFQPDHGPVRIIIAAVPGFQGLMDAQRALSSLAGVDGASVKRYQNGEAMLELALANALTPRSIVDELEQTTGHALLIEEARPEAQLLRLRFQDGDA
jgi:hypothetical protein